MAWTSRMSTALTAMSVRPRRPAAVERGVDGAGRQDRRDRAAGRSTTLRRSAPGASSRPGRRRPHRRPADRGRRRGPPGRPAGSQVASSVRIVPRPSATASSRPAQVDHDRSLEALGPRRPREPAEQCRAAAQLDPQVHHDALALGIDGGVGDLGECLAQVVGDRPVEAAAAGRRRVVAHAPQRLVAFEGHRLDVESRAFGVEAGEVAHDVVGRRRRGLGADRRCDRGPRTSGGRRRGSGACGAPRPSPRRPRGSPGGRARPAAARPDRGDRAGPSRRR